MSFLELSLDLLKPTVAGSKLRTAGGSSLTNY